MIDLVKKFFCATPDNDEDQGKKVVVATCALFMEMALIDGEFSDSEQAFMLSILKERYGLDVNEAQQVMAEAKTELDQSVDSWKFAKLINEHYSDKEKVEVVEILWEMVFADGQMDSHEEYLLKKLYALLHVDHGDFIDAKLKALRGKAKA